MRSVSELHKEIRTRAVPNAELRQYSDVHDYYMELLRHMDQGGRIRPDEKVFKGKFEVAFSTKVKNVFIDPSSDIWHAHHTLVLLDLWAQLPLAETI